MFYAPVRRRDIKHLGIEGATVEHRDLDYFAERARQERRAAGASADPRVAALHLDLADRYDAVISAYAGLDRARMRQS